MKPKNLGSVSYTPGQVPTNPADYPRYLREEFDQIAAAIKLLAAGHLDIQYQAPPKPRQGDIRYAAGAPNWDPGGGQGIYYFDGATWKLLG